MIAGHEPIMVGPEGAHFTPAAIVDARYHAARSHNARHHLTQGGRRRAQRAAAR